MQATAERGVEEAIFTVQGVIISKDLPLLWAKVSLWTYNIYHHLQNINEGLQPTNTNISDKVSYCQGLVCQHFRMQVLAGNKIYGHFDCQFSETILDT